MKTAFSVFCLFVLALIFPVLLLGTVIRFQLLNAPSLKQLIHASHVGEQLPSIIATTSGQSEADIKKVLPPATAYVALDTTVDTAMQWLQSGDSTIDIAPLKQQLRPVIETALQDAKQDDGQAISLNDVPPFSLPDHVTLSELMSGETTDTHRQARNSGAETEAFHSMFASLNLWLVIGWVVFSIGILTLVLLNHKPVYRIFTWLGSSSLVFCIETLPILITAWMLPNIISPLIPESVEPAIRTMVIELLQNLSAQLAWLILFVALGLILISIVAFLLRLLLKRTSR